MSDLADLLVQSTRDLAHARYERHLYRAWFGAALDKLYEQHRDIERQRQQLAALRADVRAARAGRAA